MLEQAFICVTCGAQHAPAVEPPPSCPICEDERQFVGHDGQRWTTHDDLRRERRAAVQVPEQRLTRFALEPGFAIGQSAFFVGTDDGHVLWDCIPAVDEAVYQMIRCSGGLEAIAISHPHFYSAMVEWSVAFDDTPIWIHADDREWVQRRDARIVFWEGETATMPGGMTLIRCGGHFPGSSVLHWPQGADGRGVLLTGDTISVGEDRRQVSFMYSYPNLLPLSAAAVETIAGAVEPYRYDRVYDAFGGVVDGGAEQVVARSAARYRQALEAPPAAD